MSNDGALLQKTNYWDSELAHRGLYFASWNAGTLRLLVPDSQAPAVQEMKTGTCCIVTRGQFKQRDALELMFEDGSTSPYALYIETKQSDCLITRSHAVLNVTAWMRNGPVAAWPGRYRVAQTLPNLARWVEHRT